MSSMREALESAFEEHSEEDGDVSTSETKAPVVETAPAEEIPLGDGETVNEEVVEPTNEKTDLKPADNEQQARAQDKPKVVPTAPPGPKAPQSWKPEPREKFGALPDDVKQEVLRREAETSRVLRESSESRQFHKDFERLSQPYSALFASENVTPLQAANDLFRQAYVIRHGTPQQKAQMIGGLISHFGIDIEMLDQVMASQITGQQVQLRQDPVLSEVRNMLAPVMQHINGQTQFQQQQSQRETQQLQSEVEQFASNPKNEFWNDVAGDVAQILELSAAQGRTITLQDAYSRATMLHPDISKVMEARKVAADTAQRTAKARKARRAGASVSGGAPSQSVSAVANSSNSRRSAIEAAWDATEGRE